MPTIAGSVVAAAVVSVVVLFAGSGGLEVGKTVAAANGSREDVGEDAPDEFFDRPGNVFERASSESKMEADQENKRNVTLVNNETTESGFMPSFHLGSIGIFPATVIELPSVSNNKTGTGMRPGSETPAVKSDSQAIGKVLAASNHPFNDVRTIKFENENADQNKQSSYRPSEKIEKFVKFVEQAMQQYQENFGDRSNHNHQDPNNYHHHFHGVPISETPYTGEYPHREYHSHDHHHHQHHSSAYAVQDDAYGNERPAYVTYWTTPKTTSGYHVRHQHPHAIVSGEKHYPSGPHDDNYALISPGQVEHHRHPTGHIKNHYDHFHSDNQQLYHLPHDEKLTEVRPETIVNVHPISYQMSSLDGTPHPKTVIYLTAHDVMKTHNPHWPHFDHTDGSSVIFDDLEHHFPYFPGVPVHKHRSVSPWRKILHVISTFLPLGLLIALLSPRVIKNSANNNGNEPPNIILSKLRVNDLPAEHKNNHISALDTDREDETTCEERTVCRLLAASDSLGSNFLRHLLLHVAERTSDSSVRKKELDKIFEAVKLGKCDTLTCNFYDGT